MYACALPPPAPCPIAETTVITSLTPPKIVVTVESVSTNGTSSVDEVAENRPSRIARPSDFEIPAHDGRRDAEVQQPTVYDRALQRPYGNRDVTHAAGQSVNGTQTALEPTPAASLAPTAV